MREKLKREIAPLLSCNKNKNLGQNGTSNNAEKKEGGADNSNALANIPERANSLEEPALNSGMGLNAGLVGSEGSVNRHVQEPGNLSAVRNTSKNINML